MTSTPTGNGARNAGEVWRLHGERFTLGNGEALVAIAVADDGEFENRYASLLGAFATAALVATRARSLATDRHRARAFRVSQGLFAVIPVLLVAFFLLGDRVDWTVLVIGLAWRAWLVLYTLPFLLAALETDG